MDQNRTGPGPTKSGKSRTEPDQQNLENLGPSRTDRSSDQAVRGSLPSVLVPLVFKGLDW